jgi:hypothetical protein
VTWTAWCDTDNEPATFRCRERLHRVRELLPGDGAQKTGAKDLSTDPAITEWRTALGQSTSARLAEAERVLTEVRVQLEESRAEAKEMRAQLERSIEREQMTRRELSVAYRNLGDVEAECARLREDLAGATIAAHAAEQQALAARSWPVARNDDAGDCFRCGRPIVRGQAVEPQTGTTKGSFAHVHCPTPTETEEN